MAMKEKDYDSTTSDSILLRIVECRFCRRRRLFNQRKQIYHNLDGFDIEVLDLLGAGGYGKVFRCRDLDTNCIVAIKQIYIFGIYDGVPSSIIREVSLLKALIDHPNIVMLLDVLIKDLRYVNLVFEHLDCDLYTYIKDQRFPNDSRLIKSFVYQILSALAYCHSHKVIHRDVKSKNLLIDESTMMIKLADFGLAREFADPDLLYTEMVATHWYRAPEILFATGIYSSAIDIWGMGCIFGEMVIKQPIFRVFNCNDQLEAIFRMLGTPTEETWPGVTKLFPNLTDIYPKFDPIWDLSTVFVDLDPAGLDLLSRMLCLDPSKRITAEAALKHPYFHGFHLRGHH